MKFRTVQRPRVQPVALLIMFGVGSDDDPKLARALPGWAIAATDAMPTSVAAWEVILEARRLTGATSDTPLGLGGFSGGCQAVRAMLNSGIVPDYLAAFDGTHADFPTPKPYQIDPWVSAVQRAREGKARVILTCTSMGYTEHLKERPFMSTLHVLERVLGRSLEVGEPVLEGHLYAERFRSADIDAAAHMAQQNDVMPNLLAACWGTKSGRPFLDSVSDAVLDAIQTTIVQPVKDALAFEPDPFQDPGIPFGRRCVLWSLVQVRHGVREDPPGSNTGPEIKRYFSDVAYLRKDKSGKERRITIKAGAWCAAAAHYAHKICALPGDFVPTPRLSGAEMVEDAKAAGRWGSLRDAKEGDLVILNRSGGEAWFRHVCRLIGQVQKDGSFQTVGGNEGDRWKLTDRHETDPDILGVFLLS